MIEYQEIISTRDENRLTVCHSQFLDLKTGRESGLAYFYKRFFKDLFWRSLRMSKCDLAAECIVQESFLRLWQFRNQLKDAAHVQSFLREHTRNGSITYYRKSSNQFHRNLIRLDGIEDYQEFIGACDELAEDEIYHSADDSNKHAAQMGQISRVLPALSERQRLFIALCLKYSFFPTCLYLRDKTTSVLLIEAVHLRQRRTTAIYGFADF